jgi:hypothetical protein
MHVRGMFTGSLSVKLALSTGPVAIEEQPEGDDNTARAKAEGLAIVRKSADRA